MRAAVLSALFLSNALPAHAWSQQQAIKSCPLWPEGQPFKPPQVTRDSHVTLSVEPVLLCSPKTGRKWMSRGYACKTCKVKTPSVPGVTIMTSPGEDLYVTLENNLRNPNPTPAQVKAKHDTEWADATKKQQNDHIKNLGYLNSTSLHLHGLHISPEDTEQIGQHTYIGDTIFTQVLPGGKPNKYLFRVRKDHMGGTHWYHPHHHHSTAIQAGGGLHGALLVEDLPGAVPPEIQNMPQILAIISLVDLRGINKRSYGGIGLLEEQGLGGMWKNIDGPEKGKYVDEDNVFALVNGMFRPSLELTAGHWTRFRFIFASVEMFISASIDSKSGLTCEMQLLAKDGIWLNVAPRTIKRIYLACGNRADIAIKCECRNSRVCEGGLYAKDTDPTFDDLSAAQAAIEANKHPMDGLESDPLKQELLKLTVRIPNSGRPQGPLKPFSVVRPCYLVDLRTVDVPISNWGRVDFWSPMDDKDAGWKVTWSDWYHKFKGAQMYDMDAPALFDLKVGEVYQLFVRGPSVAKGGIAQHPLHLHTIPYQITSLVTMDPYFMVGDWHDVLLHTAGQVVVKLQTDTYAGRYIIHCHVLSHEDYGMMTYFNVKGKDGTVWPGARKADPTCYRKDSGKPGWSYATAGQQKADSQLPSTPHWMRGPAGFDCHRACTPYGGCNGLGWPTSQQEFDTKVAMSTGSRCAPQPVWSKPTAAPYNPSSDFTGRCDWKFEEYFTSNSVNAGNYRCGKTPPPNVARFCPCNKAPESTGIGSMFI